MKLLLILLWVSAAGVQLGCVAALIGGGAVAGAGMVAYAKGELRSTETVSLDQAWSATQAAMADLDFTIISRRLNAISATLVARGAGGRRVTVGVQRQVGDLTQIYVRVGVFGDEALSRLILEKINAQLGAADSRLTQGQGSGLDSPQ